MTAFYFFELFQSSATAGRLEEVNPMLGVQRHQRFLPGIGATELEAIAPGLSTTILRPDLNDPDIEQGFNRVADVILVR
jgi:hypothetical protein